MLPDNSAVYRLLTMPLQEALTQCSRCNSFLDATSVAACPVQLPAQGGHRDDGARWALKHLFGMGVLALSLLLPRWADCGHCRYADTGNFFPQAIVLHRGLLFPRTRWKWMGWGRARC